MSKIPTFDDALEAYKNLLQAGKECRDLFMATGFPAPPRVLALLNDEVEQKLAQAARQLTTQRSVPVPVRRVIMPHSAPVAAPVKRAYTRRKPSTERKLLIPKKPDYGLPPKGAEDWVALKAIGASPHALTVAILKEYGPIERPRLSKMVSDIRGLKGSNAGYNALTELHRQELVQETPDGWVLNDSRIGGILKGDVLWSPEDQLTPADRAAHRREGILLLLELNGGMLSYEISHSLERCDWIRAGKNRNFVKADMAQLERESIVARHDDKTWVLLEVKK
jgi:hypothetical protein